MTANIVKMYGQIRQKIVNFNIYFGTMFPKSNFKNSNYVQLHTLLIVFHISLYIVYKSLTSHHLPLAKDIHTRVPYVDDIVFGANIEEQLLLRKHDIIGLLHSGACELSKLTSNSTTVLDSICPEIWINSVSVKVLSLHWDTEADNFEYRTIVEHSFSTKRQVLSIIVHLFNLIGALDSILLWGNYVRKMFYLTFVVQQTWLGRPLPDYLLSV